MSQFSRNTIIELINAFGFSTHAEIDRLILGFSLEEANCPGGIEPRKMGLMQYLVDNPGRKGRSGANLVFEIVEYLIERRLSPRHLWSLPDEPKEVFPRLVRSLGRDGYIIEGNELKTLIPETIPIPQTESKFESLLDEFGFCTAKGHFEQAISAHTRGEWASANAQLRTFIESLFDSIAETLIDDPRSVPGSSHQRRELLATLSPPFFLADLNEWELGGKGGFVQGFWRRLHPEGSHPGLSDEEDSTFRLQLVIIVASHYLMRLKNRKEPDVSF